MNRILTFLKGLVKDDKSKIKLYNILIFVLIIFMTSYLSYYITSLVKSSHSEKPVIFSSVKSDLDFLKDPNYHPTIYNNSNMFPPTVIYTNGVIPNDEFFVGEIVGIKYFGIFGLVDEKIIGVNGFTYQVRWKDNSHDLPKDIFYSWELYRPKEGTVNMSVLQN